MSNLINNGQIALAGHYIVFGADGHMTGEEKDEVFVHIGKHFYIDEEDKSVVRALYSSGKLHFDDVISDIECNFSYSEKLQLYSTICISMNALDGGSGERDSSSDGWKAANKLRNALNISRSEYDAWREK